MDYPQQYAGINKEKAEKLKNNLNVALSWLSLSVQNTVAKFTDDQKTRQVQYLWILHKTFTLQTCTEITHGIIIFNWFQMLFIPSVIFIDYFSTQTL